MIFERYAKYKDSDVDWIGNIPVSWQIKRIKDVSLVIMGQSPDSEYYEYEDNDYPFLQGNAEFGEKFPSPKLWCKNSNKFCDKGDILLSVRAPVGALNFADKRYGIGRGLSAIRPKTLNKLFLYYYLYISNSKLQSISTGSTFTAISLGQIRNFEVVSPSNEEHIKIANFLDKKVSQIDKNIKLLYDKATSYEDLKKSLIHETVLHGINKNIKLKDTGIAWIGKIPENWKIVRNKDIFLESNILSSSGKEDLLSVSEYTGVTIREKDSETGENESRADSLEGYKICKKGDLVINIMLAWKTGLGVSPFFGIVSPAYGVYTPKDKIAPEYYHYLFRTEMYTAEFRRNSTGIISSRLRLYSDKFFSIHSILPPKTEQIQIAKYLDEKTSKIDEIIKKINDQITTLLEFRKTLINDVVTGKVRIKDE